MQHLRLVHGQIVQVKHVQKEEVKKIEKQESVQKNLINI